MKEDITRMAREARIVPYIVLPTDDEYIERLERFAALVADRCAEIAYEAEPFHSADMIRKAFGVEG